MFLVILLIFSLLSSAYCGFGEAPSGWEDIRFGLVSNGIPYDPNLAMSFDTHRLKTATDSLDIKIDYRYRYVNEGVNPATNACVNLFPWKWDNNYSKKAKIDAGVEASYVIYVLQEEGGTTKLLSNISNAKKMQYFFHTLRIVAENANGHGAVMVIEPDTWGYLLQDHYQTTVNNSVEIDPRKIPAVVNNIQDTVVSDSSYIIPDSTKPWEKELKVESKEISFQYLSDLPNNMAGLGRAIIRTMHKFAPDCYVGFLASHWSVNLGLDGNGWNEDGMVWASNELIDTSAKINIEFFERLYWGSVDSNHPKQPGDDPDFIGVEKNGWCAGTWEMSDGRTNWYWGDPQMENYLKWVKQIGVGLDLPVLGWQISIGNMNNPNTPNSNKMANAYKDTFFPYFFDHVQDFIDAGFIGFLVGKGLSEATDYVLPSENYGEKGWFFNQLIEFDKGRPYDINFNGTDLIKQKVSNNSEISIKNNNSILSIKVPQVSSSSYISIYNLQGKRVHTEKLSDSVSKIHLNISRGVYIASVFLRGKRVQTGLIRLEK